MIFDQDESVDALSSGVVMPGDSSAAEGKYASMQFTSSGTEARFHLFSRVVEVVEPLGENSDWVASALLARGSVHVILGQHDRAIADLTRAAALDAGNALACNELGLVYARLGKYDQAIRNYTEALNRTPQVHVARFNRGFALRLRGDTEGAIADFTAFLQHQPEVVEAYYQRALAFRAANAYVAALADLDAALALKPAFADAQTVSEEIELARARRPAVPLQPDPGETVEIH